MTKSKRDYELEGLANADLQYPIRSPRRSAAAGLFAGLAIAAVLAGCAGSASSDVEATRSTAPANIRSSDVKHAFARQSMLAIPLPVGRNVAGLETTFALIREPSHTPVRAVVYLFRQIHEARTGWLLTCSGQICLRVENLVVGVERNAHADAAAVTRALRRLGPVERG